MPGEEAIRHVLEQVEPIKVIDIRRMLASDYLAVLRGDRVFLTASARDRLDEEKEYRIGIVLYRSAESRNYVICWRTSRS